MFGWSFRLAGAVTAAWLALATGAAAQAAAPTAPSPGTPLELQRENHANHDRWARTQPPPRTSSTADASDDTSSENAEATHSANDPVTSKGHNGELNGKLHLGEWS